MDFLAPQMFPYSVAFLIFTIFALLEFISLILGWGIFAFLDTHFDSDTDIEVQTSLGNFFGFVNPQKVPFSMVLLSFFFIFSFLGSILQNIFGLFPLFITVPIVFILTIILLRHTTNIIEKLLPKETSEAVYTDSFLGKKALILDPICKKDFPARAKLKDIYGESHYIRVEPLNNKEIFKEKELVIIMEKKGEIFLAEKKMTQKNYSIDI